MGFLSKVHLSCFLVTYLVAFAVEIYQLLRRRTRTTRTLQILIALAALLAHTAYLVTRSLNSNLPPLVGSSHDWLLVLAWLGGLMYLLAVATQGRVAIGIFLLPMTIGLVTMAVFVETSAVEPDRRLAVYRWGMLHAATLVIGLGSVAAATICALMYLLQYQKLRGRKSWLHRLQLPSLEQLTLLNRWLVVATVSMLTIGLVTGFVLVGITRGGASDAFRWSDPIVTGTVVVWGMMVATLSWLLTRRDQSGRQVARLTIVAGGFLLLTILGLVLLSGGVHGPDSQEQSSRASVDTTSAEGNSRRGETR